MTKFTFIAIIIIFSLFSCEFPSEKREQTSDQALQQQTEEMMNEANKQIGMPAIINFQEKKILKEIMELRDREDLICYAYIIDMNGNMHFLGKCVGYGIPYSTQFSNPEKVFIEENGIDAGDIPYTVPQAEPNGLFMPDGLSATWLLMIDPETNKPRPVYVEPQIMVSPFKMH